MAKFNTELFVQKAIDVHGDKYDYSKVVYVNAKTKVCIVCPIHGEFYQEAFSHLNGCGCRKCGRIRFGNKIKLWTKQACEKEARKYITKADFNRGNPSAYQIAYRNGWMREFDWFENGYMIFGQKERKWTKESCESEARKYKSKSEFRHAPGWAYNVAVINGWITGYTWLQDKRLDLIKGKIDCVYAYIFEDERAVYVGRTLIKRQRERDLEHIYQANKDAVARFAAKQNMSVPKMNVLETDLTLREGQEREHYWINWFQNNGYTILNKAKTGIGVGSIGALGNGKWNKFSCFVEAQKYITKVDFSKQSSGAYTRALKEGWLQDYTWFVSGNARAANNRTKWTFESCQIEASKYKNRNQFKLGNAAAFNVAYQNKWLEIFYGKSTYKPAGYWTYEKCYKTAQKFNTITKFAKSKEGAYAYKIAKRRGWLSDYKWFVDGMELRSIKQTKWTFETCSGEAKKYRSRTEFAKGAGGSYYVARKNKWLDIFFPKHS